MSGVKCRTFTWCVIKWVHWKRKTKTSLKILELIESRIVIKIICALECLERKIEKRMRHFHTSGPDNWFDVIRYTLHVELFVSAEWALRGLKNDCPWNILWFWISVSCVLKFLLHLFYPYFQNLNCYSLGQFKSFVICLIK